MNMENIEFHTHNAGEDLTGYIKATKQVMDLYNQSSKHKEQANVTAADFSQPSLCFVSTLSIGDRVIGGVRYEKMIAENKLTVITFIVVNEECRGNGLATDLINIAHGEVMIRGSFLVFAQVNDTHSVDFWHHNGFNEEYPSATKGVSYLARKPS